MAFRQYSRLLKSGYGLISFEKQKHVVSPWKLQSRYLKVEMHPSRLSAQVTIPGWGFDDITTNGALKQHNVLSHLFRAIRMTTVNHDMIDSKRLMEDNILFTKAYKLTRNISNSALKAMNSEPYNYEFLMDCKLTNIGTSSCRVDTDICTLDNAVLYSYAHSFIVGDMSTLGSCSFPDWWIEKFKSNFVSSAAPLIVDALPQYEKANFVYDHIINPLDSSGLLNVTGLNEICARAALAGVNEGHFPMLTEEQVLGEAKETSSACIGMAQTGDKLSVSIVLEEKATETTLLFYITNQTGGGNAVFERRTVFERESEFDK